MSNFYEILNLNKDANIETIKQAYKYKLLNTHPDKTGKTVENEISMIKLAYMTLINPTTRLKYDQQLIETTKLNGYNMNGGGLDIYNLDDFKYENNEWVINCPRCDANKSMKLTEEDLENGTSDNESGYDIIVQCNSCSLWIQVKYFEASESESEPELDSSSPNNQCLNENPLAGNSLSFLKDDSI
ncbi:unnamed protein product [Candida verbasci]|uniref:Diphthamide biosynthesis protein 4 n=1 Tax=Candida verbasci TaxID=1227364 RepID=A0A9W4TSK3_9ASCO|nr:unnamed protein product [Candida verbasci]